MTKRITVVDETNPIVLKMISAMAVSSPAMETLRFWEGRGNCERQMLAAKTRAVVYFDRELNNEYLLNE